MELISPRPAAGAQELKQELLLRAEELERLLTIYKLKLCTDEISSLTYGSKLMERSYADDFSGDQRGQFYDIYMRKREVKLKEVWRARGAEKEAGMRAMMESLASTCSTMISKDKETEPKKYLSRQTHSRKLSSSSSVLSSASSNSATSAPIPTTRSSNPPSLRKENTKPSTVNSKATTLQRSIARSQSSSERMSLVKDMKARRSQSLRKNSASHGEPKDFMPLNSDGANLAPTMHSIAPRSGAPKPILRKGNTIGPSAGVSAGRSTEMLKEGNEETWDSAYHRFESIESPKPWNSHMQGLSYGLHEASDFDSSVDSPCYDPATGHSHDVNRNLDGKTVRVRKKWGNVERPFPAAEASSHSLMDVTKGITKILKFGKSGGGMEIDNGRYNGHDTVNYSFEDLRKLRMGQSPSFDSFNEDETLHAQVESPHGKLANHSAILKQREKLLLANPPRATRALFSLPSFHRGDTETKC